MLFGAGIALSAEAPRESEAFSDLLKFAPSEIKAEALAEPVPSGAGFSNPESASKGEFMRPSDPGHRYLEKPFFNLEWLLETDSVSKGIPERYLGHPAGNANFALELEKLTGSGFKGGNSAKLLFGPESFAMRDKLMAKAEKSIYISVYSFHDDITGNQTADLLITKKKAGVDVKVLVDGKVAMLHGRKILRRLKKGGVEILRWWEPGRLLDIWHVKTLIIDGKYAFAGGMNIGDAYSHRDPSGPKWKDFDVFYSGPAVTETLKIYAGKWNSRAGSGLSKINPDKARSSNFEGGSASLAVVYQNPPGETGIMGTILKSIYGARERINIANSYFIAVPKLRQAIFDARARGVEVNIITNTSKSIDAEAKQAAIPIIRSLASVYPSGANIYLNQGENLHAKFITVDGVFATIGSYNMHPRSEVYDTEMNVNILGSEHIRQFDEAFWRLTGESKKVKSSEDLSVEEGFASFISDLIEKYFFSMLNPSK